MEKKLFSKMDYGILNQLKDVDLLNLSATFETWGSRLEDQLEDVPKNNKEIINQYIFLIEETKILLESLYNVENSLLKIMTADVNYNQEYPSPSWFPYNVISCMTKNPKEMLGDCYIE